MKKVRKQKRYYLIKDNGAYWISQGRMKGIWSSEKHKATRFKYFIACYYSYSLKVYGTSTNVVEAKE